MSPARKRTAPADVRIDIRRTGALLRTGAYIAMPLAYRDFLAVISARLV